jgi:hypothetical protein
MLNLKKSLVLIFVGLSLSGTAQLELSDSRSYHIGLQANPLLRQILNLGANEAINNPYLLRVAIRQPNSRNEFNLGLGFSYTYNESNDNIKTDNFNTNLRFGYAKKYALGSRFEAGIGLDLLGLVGNAKTVSINNFGGGGFTDSTITNTTSNQFGYGLGPRISFDYYLSKSVKIGTEASLYWLNRTAEQQVVVESFRSDFNGNLQYDRAEDTDNSRSGNISLFIPVAIYLTIIL